MPGESPPEVMTAIFFLGAMLDMTAEGFLMELLRLKWEEEEEEAEEEEELFEGS